MKTVEGKYPHHLPADTSVTWEIRGCSPDQKSSITKQGTPIGLGLSLLLFPSKDSRLKEVLRVQGLSQIGAVCLVTTLCLCSPRDLSPPGSSVHGILQARILDGVVMPFSKGIFLTQGWNPCLLHLLH